MLKDGGSKGTATSSINPTGIDHFQLGALARSSDYYHTNVFNGKIAEAQIHSTALSDAWLLHESDQTLDQATFWGTWAWTAAAGGAITGTLTGSSESVRGVLAGTRTVTGTLVSQVGT